MRVWSELLQQSPEVNNTLMAAQVSYIPVRCRSSHTRLWVWKRLPISLLGTASTSSHSMRHAAPRTSRITMVNCSSACGEISRPRSFVQ